MITHSNNFNDNNETQSETADFAPGAASWQTGRNMRIIFDFCPLAPLCEKMTLSTKPKVYKVLYCRQMRTEPHHR